MREHEEHWKELCRQASVEKDPARLSTLIQEINRLFDARESEDIPPSQRDRATSE